MFAICRRTTARSDGCRIVNERFCIVALFMGGVLLELCNSIHTAVALQFRQNVLTCRYDHRWNFHHGFCHALRDTTGQEPCLEPWTKATVDYSGANEYMEAHYGNHPLLKSSWKMAPGISYFSKEKTKGDKVVEPIYNARELYWMEENKSLLTNNSNSTQQAINYSQLLEKYGMALVTSPTRVMDWTDRQHIEKIYIEELEKILPTLFSSAIELHCFWNPMLRGENHNLSPPQWQSQGDDKKQQLEHSIPTANVASAVHVDTDVGAYDSLDDFLAIVERNQVKRQEDHNVTTFDRKQWESEIIQNRKRFAVVNFWRNTNRLEPVTTSPLAILSTRYQKIGETSVPTIGKTGESFSTLSVFPNSLPDMNQSKWYTFPNMTSNEILVFYQYDRLATQPSDLWHCAISVGSDSFKNDESTGVAAPRESFDIRALVVFDEIIDENNDRFHPNRIKPVLSFEESGCFCDEQAEKRSG